ncbi:histidinol-phosphatase [Micrococcus cohnii]|uniref:Histidinol-phosphatase n=1 Tax=Micrococcus cohnii TaxID=993416 RepID=A0A7W7GMM7_9MICC|nr:histidinol-phosphatase [Micrococcus cohnii]MBB4734908.1 histidinol-phosphatase [Micrococcus cohnii]
MDSSETRSKDHTDDLRLAHMLADNVDSITMARFKALDLEVTQKPDLTPVTDADRAAEEVIRSSLSRARARDGILGEEFGETAGRSGRTWVIDPIDGTKNFVRGVPVWATLIALVDNGEPVVGVVSAPALNRRWWAATGQGAYTGTSLIRASRIQVSEVAELGDASLSFSSLEGWRERGQIREFLELTSDVWRVRGFGDFWSYMLVAEGAVDIACEPELEVHDMAALVPIVREAGGRFTSLDGEEGPFGGNALVTNGRLHDQLLARLGGAGA